MTSQPSQFDWDASGDYDLASDSRGVKKMRRGELRQLALREREKRLGPPSQKEGDPRSSFSTPFQGLADSCEFKVIREEDNGEYDAGASFKSNYGDANSARTSTTCTSLWSSEQSPPNKSSEQKQDQAQDLWNTSDQSHYDSGSDKYTQKTSHELPVPYRWNENLRFKKNKKIKEAKSSGMQFKISRQCLSDKDRGDGDERGRPFTIVAHNPAQDNTSSDEYKGVKIDRVLPCQSNCPKPVFLDDSGSPEERVTKQTDSFVGVNCSENCKTGLRVCKDDSHVSRRRLRNGEVVREDGECGGKRKRQPRNYCCECSPRCKNSNKSASDTDVSQDEDKLFSRPTPASKCRRGGMVQRLESIQQNSSAEKQQVCRGKRRSCSQEKQNCNGGGCRFQTEGRKEAQTCSSHPCSKDNKGLASGSKLTAESSPPPKHSQQCPRKCSAVPATGNGIPRHIMDKVRSRCPDCESNSSESSSAETQPENSISTSAQTGDSSGLCMTDVNASSSKCHRDYKYNFNSNYENAVDEELTGSCFIGQYLFELWKNQCLCDVRLRVGSTCFLAHKLVLAAFSDVFCPREPQRVATICFDVPNTTPDAVFQILQYLYTSEMELTDSTLENVHIAAAFMGIHEIVTLIEEILSKPTLYNFEKYMRIREKLGLPAYLLDFQELLRDHFIELSDSPYFRALRLTDLERVLEDVDIKVESEIDVINAIVKWIEYNPMKRMKYAANLLCLVNFDCVDPEALSCVVEQNKHLFDLDAVAVLMEAFKMLALKTNETSPEIRGKRRYECCQLKDSKADQFHYDTETRYAVSGARMNQEEDDCYVCECRRASPNCCSTSCNNSSFDNKTCAEEMVKSFQEIRDGLAPKRQEEQKKQFFKSADRNANQDDETRSGIKMRNSLNANVSNPNASFRVSRRNGGKVSYIEHSPDKRSRVKTVSSLWEQQPPSVSPNTSDTDIEPPPSTSRLSSRRELFKKRREHESHEPQCRNNKGASMRDQDSCSYSAESSERSEIYDRNCASRGSSRDSRECRRSRSSSASSRKSSMSDKGSRKRVTWSK